MMALATMWRGKVRRNGAVVPQPLAESAQLGQARELHRGLVRVAWVIGVGMVSVAGLVVWATVALVQTALRN